MEKRLIAIGAAGLWLCCLAQVQAQQMTEMYIPIGRSPGVSGKSSLIGEIGAVDAARTTLTIAGPSDSTPVVLTRRTWIWLDRSQAQLSNQAGTLSHLQTGRKVEVRFRDADQKKIAVWVKVQASE